VTAASSVCAPLRSGSWSSGDAGAFTTSFSDPGGTVADIVSWALEYVSPLNEWVDQLVGNEGQVSSFASTWRSVAADLADYESDLAASATRVSELEGKTARALRKRHDDIKAVLADASEWSSATAASLELASTIVGAVHDAAVGALSELAGLIASLFGFTLNPFDKIDQLKQLSQRALGFIEVVADLIERMFDAFERLVELLRSLVPLIEEGLLYLRVALGEILREEIPLLGGAFDDLLANDPRVSEYQYVPGSDEQQDAWNRINDATRVDSLSDLIENNGAVDLLGGSDRSVVDIMEVVDENGETHYVVALPSTQDWGQLKALFGDEFVDTLKDYPATNDLDSNIALMLMDNPLLATQYERAVTQAMTDAGVPAGSDVVYTGFSQGGIMAANLASNTGSPYNTIGIVTNGSPVSSFDIPPHIPVIAFEHAGDPVPLLDGDAIDPQNATSPNRSTVLLAPPGGSLSPGETHNNANYADSVREWEQQMRDSGQPLPDFFSGEIVDRQQHTWGE
jgi:hypothetical protein